MRNAAKAGGSHTIRELSPRRERPRRWPVVLLLVVGLAVPAVLVWAVIDPQAPADQRLPPALAALIVVVELAALGIGTWALSNAPQRLDYRLRGRSLEVTTLLSRLRIPLASVRGAEILRYDLLILPGARLGPVQSQLPGYYVGRWRLRGSRSARVIVASPRGYGVLLHFEEGPPLLLAPRDPEALTALVERRRGLGEGELRSGS